MARAFAISHVRGERAGIADVQSACLVERLRSLFETTRVIKNDGTVQEGFSVGIVDFECLIELLERSLGIPHRAQTKPRPMPYVGEVGMVLEDRTLMLVGVGEIVLLPSGLSTCRRFSNRRWTFGPGARLRALVIDVPFFSFFRRLTLVFRFRGLTF